MSLTIFLWQNTWLPYVLFSLLALLEQSAMVGVWYLVRKDILVPFLPFQPSVNVTSSPIEEIPSGVTTSMPVDGPYLGFLPDYELFIIFIHYVLYVISVLFMSFAICSAKSGQSEDDKEGSTPEHELLTYHHPADSLGRR